MTAINSLCMHPYSVPSAIVTTVASVAAEQQQIVFIRNRLKLAFLSPRIQRALRDGTQLPELCLERLIRDQVPLNWDEQERRYGFA